MPSAAAGGPMSDRILAAYALVWPEVLRMKRRKK